MSASGPPLWLQAVYRLERAVGEPIESAVRSDAYFDAVTVLNRVRSRLSGTAEGVSRRCLHLVNLPAGSDVRRLREQLSRVERRLDRLADLASEAEAVERARSAR
jgi:hypothetical protein